jgi:hypothetical protein
MGSFKNQPVQQIIGEIEGVKNLETLNEVLNEQDFITVMQYYHDKDLKRWCSKGEVILNTAHIGKVMVYRDPV